MNKKKMKQISEAYERIQAIELDIIEVQATAERLLDNSTNVWLSMDLEIDLIKDMSTQQWTSTTASGFFFSTSEIKQDVEDKRNKQAGRPKEVTTSARLLQGLSGSFNSVDPS